LGLHVWYSFLLFSHVSKRKKANKNEWMKLSILFVSSHQRASEKQSWNYLKNSSKSDCVCVQSEWTHESRDNLVWWNCDCIF
jgi:hypothetical protein